MSHHEGEHQKEPAKKGAAPSKESQQPAEHGHEQGQGQGQGQGSSGKRPQTAAPGQSGTRQPETTHKPQH